RVGFTLINKRRQDVTYKVSMQQGSKIYTFSTFEETDGDSFTATVPAQSSKTYNIIIRGGNVNIDASDLYISAEGVLPPELNPFLPKLEL
ncbi:MAG: hypothetical protein ABEJ72_09260, partial [Candidatus Aenigmatarchaeota archaeon]